MERVYNRREGLTAAQDSLPDRLTKTPQDENDPRTVVRLDTMLPVYYKIRGWTNDGMPTARRLRKLGIRV
ncbi:MAG: aldehyde ferredoxin oxidoreductase C-terminal domain-containing protein [Eubacteriales bacterium]